MQSFFFCFYVTDWRMFALPGSDAGQLNTKTVSTNEQWHAASLAHSRTGSAFEENKVQIEASPDWIL